MLFLLDIAEAEQHNHNVDDQSEFDSLHSSGLSNRISGLYLMLSCHPMLSCYPVLSCNPMLS